MSHLSSLSATPSGSSEPEAAEADYEALTEALMQTQRGRWFLAEHAHRCRAADNADLRAALARIEQALAEPREPAGLAQIQEQLGALPRIEQALAESRDPPAMAELRQRLEPLTRIEQALAEPREPAGWAEIKDTLGALPRIEQALAEPRQISGIADLQERVAVFANALDGMRAEVATQRRTEPDEAERARIRARDEEMLRLLHEQRERLDALADIWAGMQTAVAPVGRELRPVATTAGFADHRHPAPPQPVGITGHNTPAVPDLQADPIEPASREAPVLFDAQTSTADLLMQTMIFGLNILAAARPADPVQADTTETSDGTDRTFDTADETRSDEPPAAVVAAPVAQAPAELLPSQAGQTPTSVAGAPAPAPPASETASVDPIVQMFIDAEQPPVPPAALDRAEPAAPTSPVIEQTRLPAWLVGAAGTEARPVDDPADDAVIEPGLGNTDASTDPAQPDSALGTAVEEDAEFDAVLFEAEAPSEIAADAEADVTATGHTEMPGGLAELTLDLLQKALLREPATSGEPARGEEHPPAAALPGLALDDSLVDMRSEVSLRGAIAALRRALEQEENQAASNGTDASDAVIPDDVPVRQPSLASSLSREPSARESADPLAPVYALSEEERIALFS